MEEPRHKGDIPRRRRITQRTVIVISVLAVLLTSAFVIAYKKLEGNINAVSIADQLGEDRPDAVEVEGPKRPMNVLVMGSDNRDGTNIGGDTPGLSDTTILLHLSADRKRAYGVSLPRDAMVDRPECRTKNGKKTIPGGLTQFNAAYAVGGPACSIKTVEHLTDIRIDHFVVIDFAGFKDMVNAINGVTVCVPNQVDDEIGKIHLPEGTYKVNGAQALDYVRVRHGLGAPNGDIGRMKRQQAFIAAMIEKVVAKGTLANPVRLYRFLDAATESLTTDTGLRPPQGAGLARVLAEEHRARERPVHHRPQPALRRGPEPPRVGAGGERPVAQDALRQAARQARDRRRDAEQRCQAPASLRRPRLRPPPRRRSRRPRTSTDGRPETSGQSAAERKQAAEEAGLCA